MTMFLIEKTTLKPGEPAVVDTDQDELACYSLIYWLINLDAPMPSEQAISNLD